MFKFHLHIVKQGNICQLPIILFNKHNFNSVKCLFNKLLSGSSDYFGVNHYTTRLVSHAEEPQPPVSEAGIMDAIEEIDPQWKR